MDSQHKRIRAELSAMAPRRAVEYILSLELPPDEAACIIERDVRRKSCVQIAMEHNLSVDAVKKYRQRAYHKISSDQHKKRNCPTKW